MTETAAPSNAEGQVKLSLADQNYERIKAYQKKHPEHLRFFQFYDLRRYTKKGLIDVKKTVAAHKEYFERSVARADAKRGKPHVCKTAEELLAEGKTGTACCHATVNNGTNHEQRHRTRARMTAQNINYYAAQMTKQNAIKGPRKLRKNVIRLRLAQLAAQQAPPTVEVPAESQTEATSND